MNKLLILLLLCYSQLGFAQLNSQDLDKESFLLGTLDDYMGHQQTFTASKDSFYYQGIF